MSATIQVDPLISGRPQINPGDRGGNTYTALLGAIAADPTAIEPWLLLADYLDEQGDPLGEWLRDDVWFAGLPQPRLDHIHLERWLHYAQVGALVPCGPSAWMFGGGPVRPLWLCE